MIAESLLCSSILLSKRNYTGSVLSSPSEKTMFFILRPFKSGGIVFEIKTIVLWIWSFFT